MLTGGPRQAPRDLEIITRHGLVNVNLSREIYARALLGIGEQVTPMF